MLLTKIDAQCALIVIDLQKGITGLQTAHPAGAIVNRSAQLARAFRERGLPVVLASTFMTGLQSAPIPAFPGFPFRRTGPDFSLNWNRNPATIS